MHVVRDEMLLRERRDHRDRHAEAVAVEGAVRLVAGRRWVEVLAGVARVGAGQRRRRRRDVVEVAAVLVISKE